MQKTLAFFPPSAYLELTGMSEHALAYSEESLEHRMLVIYEAGGLRSDFTSYLIRSLLSEGRIRYETVERTSDGLRARVIERKGPTGLLVTTTADSLHPENETRLLSITTDDSAEQTAAVLQRLAVDRSEAPCLETWHALQGWLELGPREVAIPFAPALSALIPPIAVRLRRDFGQVLELVHAHALLHQASRELDQQGRIVATVDDYEVVRELAAPLIAEGVEATVPATIRETVHAVRELTDAGRMELSVADIAKELKLDRSVASRRAQSAAARGYLSNLEIRPRQRARYVLGDPLPDDQVILPTRDALAEACTCACTPEGTEGPSPVPEVQLGLPVEPLDREEFEL